jgi:hypothetical protein
MPAIRGLLLLLELTITPRSFGYIQMSYGIGLGNLAERAVAERITPSELIQLEAVSQDFRIAKHALAQVLNKVIGVGGISLASAIADNRSTGRGESDERVLIALFKLMSFSALLLLVDEGP